MEQQPSHAASLADARPGDIITFGMYPQTVDGADTTPIQWRVLQHTDGELWILSEYLLDCKRYHAEFVDAPWQDSDLRRWLNYEPADAGGQRKVGA